MRGDLPHPPTSSTTGGYEFAAHSNIFLNPHLIPAVVKLLVVLTLLPGLLLCPRPWHQCRNFVLR
jgi:hypothetical protein